MIILSSYILHPSTYETFEFTWFKYSGKQQNPFITTSYLFDSSSCDPLGPGPRGQVGVGMQALNR